MNHPEYLAFALPAFFLFLWLEYVVVKKKKLKSVYKYESSVSNISIGIAERLLNLFITVSFYNLYVWIYENYRLLNISNAWWIWVVMLLATDFVWYWYHRLGHEVNIFWGAHIVHHQSEEFNFTVAARITTLQAIVRNVFWCILPFIGFHPNLVMTILVVHGVYSFFTHTQILEKQKWLEYIFITPSLHGVHHASDEKYLDKNYGDVFVFWDKLFGTFQKEEEKPRYGLTHPINSYSFLWQHFHTKVSAHLQTFRVLPLRVRQLSNLVCPIYLELHEKFFRLTHKKQTDLFRLILFLPDFFFRLKWQRFSF